MRREGRERLSINTPGFKTVARGSSDTRSLRETPKRLAQSYT